MGKLTSIYNFVPLNEQVFHPSWAEQVSQDAPFSDGEDGYIDVTLHNVSPLFTRNGSADRNSHDPYSAHVMKDGKRLYFLPATSIKGMLRTTLEIMSFGKMTQYTNRFFSLRDLGGKPSPDSKAYLDLMKGIKPGWLRYDDDREELSLKPCKGKIDYIDDDMLLKKYPSFHKVYPSKGVIKTGWQKSKAIREDCGELYPVYEKEGKQYRIVCSGNMNSKNRDFLFPSDYDCGDFIPIHDKQLVDAFFTVHEPTPDFSTAKSKEKGKYGLNQTVKDYLIQGGTLAVFYLPEKSTGKIIAIGMSKLIRMPYANSIDKIVKAQQIDSEATKPDLAEAIFGYADEKGKDSLRGRVQIGNAFADNAIPDSELGDCINGVLGQPKASFYPFYLEQHNNPYKTYKNPEGIAGRKLYRVHQGNSTTELPKGNGNRNVIKNPFYPVPVNKTFKLRITVHNLRKMEIGALLSALTLHNTQKVWHNIGLARGYGYGKLEIDDVKLSQSFRYSKEEYLKEFEYTMSVFTNSHLGKMWADTPEVTRLMQILSEHDKDDLKVMGLEEYKEARNNTNFGILEEPTSVNAMSFLSPSDKASIRKRPWLDAHQADYAAAQALVASGHYDEAYAKYEAMVKELRISGLDTTDEKALMDKVRETQNAEIEEQQKEAQALEEQAKQLKLLAGLGAELDAQWAEGTPKAGQYKVTDFTGMKKRTDQWMKKAKEAELTDKEKEDYAVTFHRLAQPGNHPKKEDKELADKNSKLWQKAKSKLGDRFEELLGDIYDKL